MEGYGITYSASPAGSWSANSSYSWNTTLGAPYMCSTSGTFTLPSDPIFDYNADYTWATWPLTTPSLVENTTCACADSIDGAKATGRYTVRFHHLVEGWTNTGQPPTYTFQEFGGPITYSSPNADYPVTMGPESQSWSGFGQALNGVIQVGSAVAFVVETPPGWLAGLAAAANFGLSQASAPSPPVYQFSCNAGQITNDYDVQIQLNAGTLSPALPPYTTMTNVMFDEMQANPDPVSLLKGEFGQVKVRPRIYEQYATFVYLGQHYTVHGYDGDVTEPFTKPNSYIPQGYWDFIPNGS
jgi:hypothetical protein